MKRLLAAALVLASLANPLSADAPKESLRPVLRGETTAQTETATRASRLSLIRPMTRPASRYEADKPARLPDLSSETAEVIATLFSAQAVPRSLRPMDRPGAIVEKAMARKRELARGQVCGDPDLQGEPVGYVPGRIAGCGVQNAIKLRSVSGVTLRQQPVIDCTTARAFKRWVDRGVKPAIGQRGGGLAEVRVIAHYACRTRNNRPGAKISEHGRGRAIDVAGFRLRDGSEITVLGGWNRRDDGRILRRIHGAACGPFGTVLGPESDRYHQDHLHIDTARYRSGSYCR